MRRLSLRKAVRRGGGRSEVVVALIKLARNYILVTKGLIVHETKEKKEKTIDEVGKVEEE